MPRCGGDSTCGGGRNTRCIPSPGSVTTQTFSVQLIYRLTGEAKCTSVTVEAHSGGCECGCPLSEKDCTDLQVMNDTYYFNHISLKNQNQYL